jgi:iron transport multicopper oxidase
MDTTLWTNFQSDILDPEGKAIVRYKNAPSKEPVSKDKAVNILDPYSIKPHDKSLVPPEATTDYRIMFLIIPNEKNESRAYVQVDGFFDYNNYEPQSEPVLFKASRGLQLDDALNAVSVDLGEVVDVTIFNDDAMPHTFHMHGHNFWVIRHGHTINLRENRDPRARLSKRAWDYEEESLHYPIRDTVEVPPCVVKDSSAGEGGICGGTKGYVTIRFIADNPGVWIMHCHMEWHMQQGLAFNWIEGQSVIEQRGPSIPWEIRNTCRNSTVSRATKHRKFI